jgi:hypothetical protein
MIWVTRVAAVPGRYAANGVWGNATLDMRSDGQFIETWHFISDYNGRDEGSGSIQGKWHDDGRDWFTRNISLDKFNPLAEYSRGQGFTGSNAIVEGYSFATALDVDPGADITFFK